MSRSLTDSTQDDPRVLAAAREYLAELEAGRQPDRRAYLARYPELAEALGECLEGIELAQALRPPATPTEPEIPPVGPGLTGEPLGDFQIVREIGRGGMGIVYEAVQLSLGRRVALKVLPFAAALDARQLQRFKTEAHAAAQLHHTNIVPVHAVGADRGVHYYAMQLIEGRSLAAVIEELQTEHPGPTASATTARGGRTHHSTRGRESFRLAAELAAQVADALEYAHEAGVVHRDIKPANLLVDGRGAIWVTDFGLAQIAAATGLTQTGDMVGTLRYMSPEQAGGQRVLVDHRTDIYSLGATLYELLTLQPIFDGSDRLTLLHQILHDEPRPLRHIDRAIPVELETIVLKAVAKNPAERYATAGEMAADLRRFLDEKPILARQPTLVDRGRKWLRRHPGFVGAAMVFLVLASIGLGVAFGVTQSALDRERQRAEEAEARFQLARRAADDMLRVAQEELADNPMLEGLRRRLLESALAYYQEFVALRGEKADAAELKTTRDQIQSILADLALLQGDRQTFLLKEKGVLEDLRLSPSQSAAVGTLTASIDGRREQNFRDFYKLTAEQRRQRMLEEARANEADVSAILTAAQVKRLGQINLQWQGPRAFREPEVVRELKLTPDQRERIRGIEGEVFFVFGPKPGGPGGPPIFGGPGGVRGVSPEQQVRVATEKIVALLTPDQVERWKGLVGEPYTGPIRLGPPIPLDRGGPPDRGPPPEWGFDKGEKRDKGDKGGKGEPRKKGP
jgi:serine/threonine protein kinase